MEKIKLVEPKLKDYSYCKKILEDNDTMSYNAGWNVSFDGYDCNTGCIAYPKRKWKVDYQRRLNNNKEFYYLILREKDNTFVGNANYKYNVKEDRWTCGVVIESTYRSLGYGKRALELLIDKAFNETKVPALYDDFEENRFSSKMFFDLGFEISKKYKAKRFNEEITIVEVVKKGI